MVFKIAGQCGEKCVVSHIYQYILMWPVGWGDVRTPTLFVALRDVGVRISPQPTEAVPVGVSQQAKKRTGITPVLVVVAAERGLFITFFHFLDDFL